MAKKQEEALTPAPPQAMALPDYLKVGEKRGTENITSDDIRPPALRLAQGTTPQTKRQQASFIDGLREGMFFNSLSNRIYGEKVRLIVINQLGHRHVQFAPMAEGGGVIDFNIPDADPRTQFSTVDGKRVKPAATKFYDYLVFVVTDEGGLELCTMSLKGTQLKKAIALNTTLKTSKLDSFAHLFEAEVVPESKASYNWYGWRISSVGYVSEGQYQAAEAMFNQMKGKKIEVETEENDGGEDDDKTPF